ncbi:endo-alpha-N-acetylgalactosaminidase family protein [Neobacillus sp. WH10]|uniref:endo-alpha-N-acetylgalactosaminidase family protein n=1 Tax=Neobacillus sp. WH10 TaxID=3047873 RepID=UPI0024C1EDFB|nr:endo-alpha-N-acetylgalactosaminidase family protein [Neobacillus sp. WH10]WHY77082.1 endo-alpha-N-acetylgalactosaminidase family protein [Neobacillus sp. WH10]
MRSKYYKRVTNALIAFVLFLPMFLTGFTPPLRAEAVVTNPWVTISSGGNEVNEMVNQNGKAYARLGAGAGNDNGAKAAIFQEKEAVAHISGTMEYTFIPELKAEDTRFGFYPHYIDHNNFVFVGYDSLGWFYEYKYQGSGTWLQTRPSVPLPEAGTKHSIKIDYNGTALKVTLDGKDLFGAVTLSNDINNLLSGKEAVKLGAFGGKNSQVLLELGDSPGDGGTDPGNGGTEPGDQELVDISDNQLEDGDFKIISGDGKVTYNQDGSATFHVTSTQKNRIVYNKMKPIKNGIFEADITPGTSAMNRFGLIYRVQNPSAYTYVGTGDQNNLYFGEIFGPANSWTAMTSNVPLEANKTYHLRIKFSDDLATLYINDKKVNTFTLSGGVDQAGLLGFEKSRGAADITISNIKIKENVPPKAPNTPPVEDNLSSDYMNVIIDQVFPRVIEYRVGNKVMNGQKSPVYGLKVNGVLYYPEVSFEKKSKSEALYTLKVKDEYENLDAVFKVSLKVNKNKVIYTFEEITNAGSSKIETVELADLNFISVNSAQTNAKAKLTNLSSDVTKPGDVDVTVDSTLGGIGTSERYYTAFLSTDKLSAGVWSSSEVNGYRNLVANRYQSEDGTKAIGIGSSLLYYQREFMSKPQSKKPTVKIAIADDLNRDNEIDWQDGAIAYREIMQDIPGSNDVNNLVGQRIAMNFGSQAQQPFLKTLDNVKKVALATDGLGQSVLLKGYGNEGHDSAHPDYGNVGERIGGAEDIKTLIREGHKYNSEFGVHINAQETYPEAKAFNEDFIDGPNSRGWGWLDQSYTINKLKDLYSGTRAKRLDELKAAAPGLDFIYLDVWYQDQWESDRISEQFHDRGWRVATEFGTSMANYSTWQHWATDKNYGGPASKGINSEVLRFISNHQKDSWVLNWPESGGTADHPLLGGFELAGFEGWQSDKNFDHFIRMTFDTNLPTKFLQKYFVIDWANVEGDKSKTNLEKEIKLADPSNGDVVVVTRKDNSRERVITLNGNVVLDEHAYLIPWVEQDFKNPTQDSEKLYHWNLEGGTTTWTLPNEYAGASKVYVYKLTDQGRTDVQKVKVVNNQVTLTAEAATPYIVVPKKEKGLQVDDWSKDAHVYDTGFNSGTVKDPHTKVAGDKDAVSVVRTNQTGNARNVSSGDYFLNIDSPSKNTSVSRTITGLEPGKDYVAEVYVENNSDVKAGIKVNGEVKNVSNYTLRSLQKNFVKADSHATNDGYNSKMQRMQVSFTAAYKKAELILSREAGEGTTKFDDIRIVQKSLKNEVSPKVFEQDFESVVQGIYPFVIGNTEGVEDNRIHLSELHAPYTQKGWAGKKLVDDVIKGNWSVKVNTGNKGLVYRTIPQHFHFEPGVTYKVSFDYQTTANSYRFISGDQEIDARDIAAVKGLSINNTLSASTDTKKAEYTVTGSENGQTYIGIFSDGTSLNGDTGAGTFILDNLRIEQITN